MNLPEACKMAGGHYDPTSRTCKIGVNEVRELDEARYEIVTPHGNFVVNGYRPQYGNGLYFPFNNCAVEVRPDAVDFVCFAPASSEEFGASFEATFKGAIRTSP